MGVGFTVPQGVSIKVRSVDWKKKKRRLTRITEVSLIGSQIVVAQGPAMIRQEGLLVGMHFRAAHRVRFVGFTAAPKNQAAPENLAFTELEEDADLTDDLEDAFGKDGQWVGYTLTTFPAMTWAPENEALYFKVVVENFRTQPGNPLDFHVVPIVAVLGNSDFKDHYVLGIGAFTVGKGSQSIDFNIDCLAVP